MLGEVDVDFLTIGLGDDLQQTQLLLRAAEELSHDQAQIQPADRSAAMTTASQSSPEAISVLTW